MRKLRCRNSLSMSVTSTGSSTNALKHTGMLFFSFEKCRSVFKWLLSVQVTVTVALQGRTAFGAGGRGGADIAQLPDQCGEKPVARLQPTTGVMSHIFTMRSVPQVTISPLAMSMDMWEMLCFPS